MRSRNWKKHEIVIYGTLIALRAAFAFFGMGYIHPDEYFQNGEVTAATIFGVRSLQTWEWNADFPCRSIVPPFLSTGVPFLILKFITKDTTLKYIFTAERLSFFLLSFLLDYAVYTLVPLAWPTALILLASSSTILTFQLRPFSNSLEAILLATLLVVWKKSFHASERSVGAYLSCIATIMLLGIFNRITFLAFSAPIAFGALVRIYRFISSPGHPTRLLSLASPVCVTVVIASILVGLDSWYFLDSSASVVLTPYNFLLYNLSAENLATHGLHPRWLHVTVNLPMIIGPSVLFIGVKAGRQVFRFSSATKDKLNPGASQAISRTCVYVISISLALLSIQPHQEPRFLTPLLVPFVVLIGNSGLVRRAGRWFWMTTLVFNATLCVVFGFLHQGGVVPSLLHLHGLMYSQPSLNGTAVVYWKTYMPPRHLLAIPEHDPHVRVNITDLAGARPSLVEEILISSATPETRVVFLVTPLSSMLSIEPHMKTCFFLEKSIFPHLDLDHISESVAMGWKDGLSLGIYVSSSACLRQLRLYK